MSLESLRFGITREGIKSRVTTGLLAYPLPLSERVRVRTFG
jgi:hypothetical protein